jgi:protease PrsW
MSTLPYFTLAFAPILAGFLFLFLAKRYDNEYKRLLVLSYLGGFLGIVFLLLSEYISTVMGLNDLRSLKRTLFFSFLTIGFSSELGKFLVYRYLVIPGKVVDRPIHAITFSVMTALGFCTLALLFYFLNIFNTMDLFPNKMYPFLFVPANFIFAVIMGFFVGMARFIKIRFLYSLIGLLGAAFFHGLFNFCLITHDFKLLSLFSFGSVLIVMVLVLKASFTTPETST